jgi:hypothetical protein
MLIYTPFFIAKVEDGLSFCIKKPRSRQSAAFLKLVIPLNLFCRETSLFIDHFGVSQNIIQFVNIIGI